MPATAFSTVAQVLHIKTGDPVAVFAHRGGYHCEKMDNIPENSIPNVEKAISMGFDGYETDLWVTADGKFIIHHDDTLDRTTTGTGSVTALTLQQLRKLNLKYPSGKVSSEKIPTFRELLEKAQGRILFLVELKGKAPEHFHDLLKIIRETKSADKVLFWIDYNEEYLTLYEQYQEAGIKEVHSNILWRARNLEQFQDIAKRFNPRMVDLPATRAELAAERKQDIIPERHLALVETVQKAGINVLASKIGTNAYLELLLAKNVKAYMTRSPEVQLVHLIDKGLHH